MKQELLFSITRKDFRIDTFRAGGPGGQNQNKRETGVRFTHLESSAVGESRDERSQDQNKKRAFRRCIESKTFQNWFRIKKAYALQGVIDTEREINRRVDEQMKPENLKIEYYSC